MKHRNKRAGCAVMGLGLTIILALILPATAWWFILGAFLICAGMWLFKCGF